MCRGDIPSSGGAVDKGTGNSKQRLTITAVLWISRLIKRNLAVSLLLLLRSTLLQRLAATLFFWIFFPGLLLPKVLLCLFLC